jgi:aspartate aminotransferase
MLSKRVSSVGESLTIGVTAKAAQMRADGQEVVSFAAGEPDFDTPDFIKKATESALEAGDTKYNPRQGKALQAAIAEKLTRENNLPTTADQVVVTFGGKHALYTACQVLIDPGDKVLIPAPYWVSYPEMTRLAGGEPVILPTSAETNYKITPDQLRKAADGAKILILNSPSNPTGETYSPAEFKALAQVVLETDLIVFSDEIYEKLVYGNTQFVSFASLDPALPDRTVTFNGLSKTWSMTGWRLGWAAGPKEIIGAMRCVMSHATTNPVSFLQAGALAAYTDPQSAQTVETMRKAFAERGEYMHRRLNAMDGISCRRPAGAFYCFPDVSAHYGRALGGVEVTDSMSFATAVLEQAKIAIVPGVAFGQDAGQRLSFATSMEQIAEGLDRLEAFLKG